MSEHGRAHRCKLHDLPNCSRPHQTVPYVRVGSTAHSIGEWEPASERLLLPAADRLRAANPVWRWAAAIAIVLLLTAVIVVASIYIGGAAAESYGPLITITPSPTSNGWTP
jgi:hypothetical protein